MLTAINLWINRIDMLANGRAWGLHAYPLLVREERRHRRRTLRWSLRLGLSVGAVGLVLSTLLIRFAPPPEVGLWGGIALMLAWLVMFIAPLQISSTTARLMRTTLRAEHYDLIYITPLSNRALVRSHFLAGLHRGRAALFWQFALMPLLTVFAFYLIVLDYAPSYYGTVYYTSSTALIPAPGYWQVVGPTLVVGAMLVGLWGMSLLGAALSVRESLLRRQSWLAPLTSSIVAFVVFFLPCGVFTRIALVPTWSDPARVLVGVLMATVPYWLTLGVLEMTARNWRREP